MNYNTQLLKEHSRPNTDAIAKAIGNNANEFKKIIDIIYNARPPLPQRASWILSAVNDIHPQLLEPHLSKFIETVSDFKIDGIKRNMMMVLASHSISEKLQGKLVSLCFDFMLSPTEKVVVKVYAMQCIATIAEEHRELIPELKTAIEDQLPKTTAAFHARAKMILKEMKNRR